MSRLGVILVLAAIVLIVILELQTTGVKGEETYCEDACRSKHGFGGKFSRDQSGEIHCKGSTVKVMPAKDCDTWCNICGLPFNFNIRYQSSYKIG
eukprot:Nk52_evm1s2484 gene=Nk52_evmTU1s2484